MLYKNEIFPLKAFTLAELLIVLGIIGIVAALTMPSLIADHREKEAITRLKKAYSTLSQVHDRLGPSSNWRVNSANDLKNMLEKNMNLIKTCDMGEEGCWYNSDIAFVTGSGSDNLVSMNYASAISADGTLIAFEIWGPNCTIFNSQSKQCFQIIYDINGAKKPNQWGKDVFAFIMLEDRVVPRGLPEHIMPASFESYCKSIGHACAGWVIVNENMDYLHCKDLSWNGKTKCK